MVCSLLIASAIILAPVERPRFNSVQWFDNEIRVSQRVLDRTICRDIDRVQTLDPLEGKTITPAQERARAQRKAEKERRNIGAVVQHCRMRLQAEGLPDGECTIPLTPVAGSGSGL